MKHDIGCRADIEVMVDAAYEGIQLDPVIGRYFVGVDLRRHRARMCAFWAQVVLGEPGYEGDPFAPHARMPGLGAKHFDRWLERFEAVIDARFEGPVTRAVKGRVRNMARAFQFRLALTEPPAQTGAISRRR